MEKALWVIIFLCLLLLGFFAIRELIALIFRHGWRVLSPIHRVYRSTPCLMDIDAIEALILRAMHKHSPQVYVGKPPVVQRSPEGFYLTWGVAGGYSIKQCIDQGRWRIEIRSIAGMWDYANSTLDVTNSFLLQSFQLFFAGILGFFLHRIIDLSGLGFFIAEEIKAEKDCS